MRVGGEQYQQRNLATCRSEYHILTKRNGRRGYLNLWVWFEMTAEPPPPDKNPFSFKNFVSRRVQGEDEDVIKVKKAPKKAKGKHTDPSVPFPEVGDPKNG